MTSQELTLARDLIARARITAEEQRHTDAVSWHRERAARRAEQRATRRAKPKRQGTNGRCVYCGKPRKFTSVACFLHVDLPALDPKYNGTDDQRAGRPAQEVAA